VSTGNRALFSLFARCILSISTCSRFLEPHRTSYSDVRALPFEINGASAGAGAAVAAAGDIGDVLPRLAGYRTRLSVVLAVSGATAFQT
jgi:hypothetical protein